MAATLTRTSILGAIVIALSVSCGSDGSQAERQAEVREAGAEVMPFDLDRTTHAFMKTDTGGFQIVLADDLTDDAEVQLIRDHLREISDSFARGDFSDPSAIHGADMPGVKALAAGAAALTIAYEEVEGGGQITYTSEDPALVDALHRWFDAQLADHGSDATDQPIDHQMTREMWEQHHPGEPYPGDTAAD